MTDVTDDKIIISSGQSKSDLIVNMYGEVEVKYGGTLTTATVNPGGLVTISSGGTATVIKENGGCVDDRNGAMVTFVPNTIESLLVSDADASIHEATTVNTTQVTADGWLTIYPGATVNDITVTDGGEVETDGNVTNVIASDAGYVDVRGGLMDGATIDDGGVGVVYYRGTAWNVVVKSGGRYMLYGGLAIATTVSSGGSFIIQEGIETISGSKTAYTGSAKQTVVTGGTMRVISGGAATDVNITTGHLSAFNRGMVDQLTMTGGTVIITGTTDGVGTLTNLNMSGGYAEVESGGLISGADITGGTVMVRKTGTLADAKLSAGIDCTILGSGSAIQLDGAIVTLFGGVTTAVLNTGDLLLQEGTVVDGATVNAGFVWNTQAGTLITGTTVKGGEVTVAGSASGAVVDQGSFTVVTGGAVQDVTVYDGSVGVGADVVAKGVNVGSAKDPLDSEPEVPKAATLNILNGGSVENLTVTHGGTANVNELASVTGAITTDEDAVINLSSGAAMRDVEVNLGTVNVAGILNDIALHGRGVSPVGAMFPPTYPDGAELNVLSGGTAFDATLDSASAIIGDGGVVSGATLNKVARMTVSGGGLLTGQVSILDEKDTGVTVAEGGIVNFDLTGTPAAARIDGLKRIFGAPTYTLTVDADLAVGTYRLADNAGTFNGTITVKTADDELGSISFLDYIQVGANYYILKSRSGGVDLCVSAEVPSLPYATVYANSEWADLADGTSVDVPGGTAIIGRDAFASADQASDAVRLDGVLYVTGGTATFVYGVNRAVVVESGAAVTDSKVNSGATLTLNTGAAACNLRVEEGATLAAQSGTTLTGECLWDIDASVWVSGEIVFDVSASTAETYSTQYWNLGKNTGTPSYSVVIGEAQENGQYILAWNTEGQGAPATLKLADGTEIGTLTPNIGLRYGDQTYTLGQRNSKSANWLRLAVADYVPPLFASSDIDGNDVSDVMFVWETNNQIGYWMNGQPVWQGSLLSQPSDWNVFGSYDMNGDRKADAVMIGNGIIRKNADMEDIEGVYVGYYSGGDDQPDGSTWVTLGFLENPDHYTWENAVGNLTGNGNSLVWFAQEQGILGIWLDGTDDWLQINDAFLGEQWTLAGCGDFDGDGLDSILMCYNGHQYYYANLDGTFGQLSAENTIWSGCEVRAIGDFSGDGIDDIVLYAKETGSIYLLNNGNPDDYTPLAQLSAATWDLVGSGDYDGDHIDDLLIRQNEGSFAIGYFSGTDKTLFHEIGCGIHSDWSVIA